MNNSTLKTDSKKILLVDDNEDVLVVIKVSLELLGYQVLDFANGQDALAQFETLQPDLAIIDNGLPGISGLKLGIAIRQLASGAACPMVLLTGTDSESIRGEATEIGFNDFLLKPAKISKISDCISRLLPS